MIVNGQVARHSCSPSFPVVFSIFRSASPPSTGHSFTDGTHIQSFMASLYAAVRVALQVQHMASLLTSTYHSSSNNNACNTRYIDLQPNRWLKPLRYDQRTNKSALGVLLRSCCTRKWECVTLVTLQMAWITSLRLNSTTRVPSFTSEV